MLSHLRIQNFKSWRDTGDIQIGVLTAFFGANSTGKSALLRFLMMLKQTVESNDHHQVLQTGDRHSYVDVGTFFDFIYRRDPSNDLEFELGLAWGDLSGEQKGEESIFPRVERFKTTVGLQGQELVQRSFTYSPIYSISGNEPFEPITIHANNSMVSLTLHGLAEPMQHLPLMDVAKSSRKFYSQLAQYDFASVARGLQIEDNQQLSYIRHALENMYFWHDNIEQLFTHTYYLGPLRESPERIYVWGGQAPQDVGRRGENTVAVLLSERGREIQATIAQLLIDMGLIHSFQVDPIAAGRREYEVLIQITSHAPLVPLTDVGAGLAQVLPVLVLCWYVPDGSIVILEQPELHLHPRAQYALADVLIRATQERGVQIILESHSEHLLTRMQRRIAEGGIAADAVQLYFTTLDAEGTSQLGKLVLDAYGNISNFPPDFFGNDLKELSAMLDAELERRGIAADTHV